MKKQNPTFLTIARRDYYSSYCITFFITSLCIYIAVQLIKFPLQFSPHYLLLFIFIALGIILWRVGVISKLLSNAVFVKGTIESIYTTGSGLGSITRMEYSYDYNGENFKRTYPKRKGLEENQEVMVALNPDVPQKSIIKDIFE